ncbi:MAG TPA: serine/threonine-protein kinase, partial [Verrucomicrobiae bacterium]|nr:serine/threonine-protein kinase [Verrucomicrobiae bacterium]
GTGGNFAERFNREARALARLSHPHIVAVHEFGQTNGLNFFLMEYVDGVNLRQLQQRERLSPRDALQIIPQICDALQYAHDEGVVHRDIKPENVLVDRKGRVKIADFGLAKIMGRDNEALRLTAEGQIMGTPHYMAPEQLERPLAVDHRADIYSLGVVFYEMLTGDLPLGKFPPPSSRAHRAGVQVDVRLDEIVLRALENDPERRYQKASEVKQRLDAVAAAPEPQALPTVNPEQPDRPKVRELLWAGIPVVVERDGEREVSYNGALTAIVVSLLCLAVGFLLVRLITGAEHVSPRLCYFVAVATVMWGIRRTLHQPRVEETPQRTAQGTVILAAP